MSNYKFTSAQGITFDTNGRGIGIPTVDDIANVPTSGIPAGSIVYAVAQKKIYSYDGAVWAVSSGTSGSSGSSGSAGTSGSTGSSGSAGTSGSSGSGGSSGSAGTSGSAGSSGSAGTSGSSGNSGSAGSSGSSGQSGSSGSSGSTGTSGTSGSTGTSGSSGISLNWRSTYSAGTTYNVNDMVYYEGASYVSLINNNIGNTPSTSAAQWAVIALGGTSGASGAQGAQGTNGTAGTSGISTANARTVTSFTATSGQTTFSATYTVGQVDVFYNGAKLSASEFTATNGTSVVLNTAATLGAVVDITGWSTGGGIAYASLSATAPLVYGGTSGVFSMPQAGNGTSGYLSSSDWISFSAKNATGAQGPAGTAGTSGSTGSSGSSGSSGSTGTSGSSGSTGSAGSSGSTGTSGSSGSTGSSGSAGSSGSTGTSGSSGSTGSSGSAGTSGSGGSSGSTGSSGSSGSTGSSGTSGAGTISNGTSGYVAKFTGATTLGNSIIQESGASISISGASAVTMSVNATDTTSYSAFYHSEGGTPKAYWEYVNSTYATTARRSYLEAYNIIGGFSIYTANIKALDINTSQVATFSSGLTTNGTVNINGGYAININSQNGFQLGADAFSGGFYVYDNTAAVYRFKIANGGSATFSGSVTLSNSASTLDVGGVLIVRGNGSAYSTHYLTTGVANVAKYLQYDSSGNAINQINAGGSSYITGGSFGIGSSTPSEKLYLQSGNFRMFDPSSNANAGYQIQWASNAGGSDVSYALIEAMTETNATRSGNLRFYTSSNAYPTERMRITSGGNINMGSNLFNQNYGRLNILSTGSQLYNGITVYSSDGTDSFIGLGSNGTVSGVNLTYGSTGSYLPFVAIVGGSERMRIGTDGAMAFNTSITGVRSYLFKALSGRQLAIEALESGGVHSVYLRPSSSGRNLITSNYFSGGAYLPLALSGRENDTDLVLQTNGNISVGSSSDAGTKFQINGANYIEMATFTATSASASAIVSANAGYVEFSNSEARHISNTGVFSATTNGIQILKAGIVHVTVSQDIITSGTTGYVALFIRKNGTNISENLISNTNGQWDGINGVTTTSVNANDVINFYYSGAEITQFDPGTWSMYSFIWASR